MNRKLSRVHLCSRVAPSAWKRTDQCGRITDSRFRLSEDPFIFCLIYNMLVFDTPLLYIGFLIWFGPCASALSGNRVFSCSMVVTFPIRADVWNGKAHWSYVNCVWIAVCLPSLTNDEWCFSDSFSARRGVFFFTEKKMWRWRDQAAQNFCFHVKIENRANKLLDIVTNDRPPGSVLLSYITYYRRDYCVNIVSVICGVMIQEKIYFIAGIQVRDFSFIIFCKQCEKRGLFYNPVLHIFSCQSCLPQCN